MHLRGFMIRPYDAIEGVAHQVIGCAIEVHRILGPGLLESVYQECLPLELTARGLFVETEVRVPIVYKEQKIATSLRIDLLVERSVVVEVKAIEALHPIHEAQLITYLVLTGYQAGLLMNFNEILLKNGLRRLDHPERYARRKK
jgi:GxxExxY protein